MIEANQRVCADCGRKGHLRSMRYTIRGTYVCSNFSACANRQKKK